MTRFSLPRFLKSSSSSPEREVELSPQLVRAPRLASNFPVHSDSAECKIYENVGKAVIYSFRSITQNITRLLFPLLTR
jgi:hypothetical protein